METTIYYFSATGNSLNLTKKLANALGNCRIIPIPQAIKESNFELSAERIGFIFPVFAWGMPRIVAEFIERIVFKNSTYIFAIVTCVAIPGNTLVGLGKILKNKGVQLDAGFAVKAGRSSLMKLNTLDKIIMRLDREREKMTDSESRFDEIVDAIKSNRPHGPEKSTWIANVFGSLIHPMAVKTFMTADSSFIVSDKCKGCGNCVKLCPRSNISLENKRPVFMNNCELCHACIQWCPSFAIKHPDFDLTLKQYHNPAVTVQDIMSSNSISSPVGDFCTK